MINWRDVPMPHNIALLPRDPRGVPIGVTVLRLPDGRVDFTTSDAGAWEAVARGRACGICGIVLREKVWFIGGPKSWLSKMYFDHPMHEECARYSLLVCPYLSLPRYLGAKKRITPDELRLDLVSSDKEKPVIFALSSARLYRVVVFQTDRLLQVQDGWYETEWWKDGAPFTNSEKIRYAVHRAQAEMQKGKRKPT